MKGSCFSPALAAALLLGMLLASRLPALPPMVASIALLLLAAGLLWQGRSRARLLAMLMLGFALLCLHAGWRLSRILPDELAGQVLWLEGQVEGLPQHDARRSRFDLRLSQQAENPPQLRGKRIRVSWYEERAPAQMDTQKADKGSARWRLAAGETWRMAVLLRPPQGLRNPGGFDAERQMLLDNIQAIAQVREPDAAVRLATGRGIDAWRERMSAKIAASGTGESLRFVAALALGDTRGLDEQDWYILRATGLTHLIAISGFHVGMVGVASAWLVAGIYWLLPYLGRRLPRRMGMAIGALAGALLYLFVSGSSLPTVRTVLMIAFVCGAVLLRRPASVAQSVAVALMVILLADPLSVLRPGLWLSFAGVAWLAWCLDAHSGGWVRQFLLAQAVVSLGLLPLTAAFFGQISAAAPIANLLAVPWWSLVVVPLSILGVLAEVIGSGWGTYFWQLAEQAFALGWPLFEALSASPLALHWLPEPSPWAVPLALLGVAIALLPRGMPGRGLALLLCVPLLFPKDDRPAPGELHVVQLDVGQGLAMLIRTHRHALLYDTGPAQPEGFDAGARIVVPALRAMGVRQLDTVVVSHADMDHAGGLEAVRRELPIRRLLAPPGAPLQAQECLAGTHWTWDGVTFEFLHPSTYFPYLGNQSSCVLRIESRHGRVLLTGDIGHLIEARLMRQAADALQADVVSVPHHGSGSSSSGPFVAATGASLALVSAGRHNRFQHPRPEVLARWQDAGSQTLISHQHGALHIHLGTDGVHWQGERQRKKRLWDVIDAQ